MTALFGEFAATTRSRAPLYSTMAKICAEAPWCHELMASAPPLQRLPVLWFACLHRICLDHPTDPLGAFFATVATDAGQVRTPESLQEADLAAFCERHRPLLQSLLSTRRTQTNEVGRCALLLPVLDRIAGQTKQPLRLLDVGSSAGLTLLIDRYNYRYEPGGEIRTDPLSPVLTCAIRGDLIVPERVPEIAARRGIDLHPLNLDDPEDALWLQACVWSDQTDRSRTLAAAIDTARRHPVDVRTAEAVEDLPQHLEELSGDGHLVVTTTWVLSYLSDEQIARFMNILDDFGGRMDITWLGAEQPDQIAPIEVHTRNDSRHLTHLITREWRNGARAQTTWATAHPHGYWMHWSPHTASV